MFASTIRPLFTLLLTGLILLGNAPAWWHHGTCNSEACHKQEMAVVSGCATSHCCHSHQQPVDENVGEFCGQFEEADGGEAEPHDSDHCLACQSAIAGLTASIDFQQNFSFDTISLRAMVCCESASVAAILDSVRPRGPPAFFA